MKLEVVCRDGKFRIVDEDGKIAVNSKTGKPLDGGGHTDNQKAQRQAGYIMESVNKGK
jgi:hypothetical protein